MQVWTFSFSFKDFRFLINHCHYFFTRLIDYMHWIAWNDLSVKTVLPRHVFTEQFFACQTLFSWRMFNEFQCYCCIFLLTSLNIIFRYNFGKNLPRKFASHSFQANTVLKISHWLLPGSMFVFSISCWLNVRGCQIGGNKGIRIDGREICLQMAGQLEKTQLYFRLIYPWKWICPNQPIAHFRAPLGKNQNGGE